MTSKKGITPARLITILKRQAEPRWGADYLPAILATPQEAPSLPHALTLNSQLLGREVHTLSFQETAAALLALYHPNLVELHEQKMLAPWATPHPLVGFPGLTYLDLPPLLGIIDVAERLGYLNLLPRLRMDNPETPGKPEIQVFPFLGDLLLFLRDESGRIYCVNWSIKDQDEAFKTSTLPRRRKSSRTKKNPLELLARHEMEEVYSRDAGIKTVRIAGETIDWHLVANLKQLFLNHGSRLSISPSQQITILDKYRIALDLGIPPLEVAIDLLSRGNLTDHDCRTVFYQSIWRRELRIDLFRPILFDKPLAPEKRDVLDVYANWFQEA